MKTNRAVFIISHERANNVKSYNLLKEIEIPIYIVIDNLDKEKEVYKKNYDNVLIFKKKDYFDKVDTMINKYEMGTPLYARKACQDYAKKFNIEEFIIIDDDIEQISCRYESDSKLKAKKIKNVNKVIDAVFKFLDTTKIYGLCIANSSFYFGGLNNKRFIDKLFPGFYEFMFLKLENEIEFKGTINEDINATINYNEKGKPLLMIMDLCFSTDKRGTNKGGCNELYKSNSEYVKAMYALINSPSRIKINRNIKENVLRMGDFPKFINERWKK